MTIIITGASRGIGCYLADEFKKIATVLEISRKHQVDVTNEDQVNSFFSVHKSEIVDPVLINCAGINIDGTVHKLRLEDWSTVLNTNLTGSFLATKAVLPMMREQSFGRIIYFSSVVPQKGVFGTAAYSSSKAALWGLTKVVAMENAEKGVTANCVNLGYMDIGMLHSVPEKLLEGIRQNIPMKRFGNRVNILNCVRFLIESDYTTGTQINLNGGLV